MSIRAHKRRPSVARLRRSPTCESHLSRWDGLPSSPLSSPAQKLAKLRVAVLEHLKDLETRLTQLESPLGEIGMGSNDDIDKESDQTSGQSGRSGNLSAIDEARVRVDNVLEMLKRIRLDVCSHIPDFSFEEVRSHMPSLELPELELRLPAAATLSTSLDDVSFKPQRLQSYLPKLKNHLDSLHEHIFSLQLSSPLKFTMSSPSSLISELLSKLQDPDLFTDPLKGPFDFLGDSRRGAESGDNESVESKALSWEHQVLHGLIKSHHGERLIHLQELPLRHQNNDFVLTGYRFIPLSRWPRLLFSVFQLHNETANIWTHLIPLLISLASFYYMPFSPSVDIAERVYIFFANVCLASSCVWHVMSGCSSIEAMEAAARVDYVGIGWLISASISSIMHYGFSCRPRTALLYLTVAFSLGITGSILPFMTFFNERQNKNWRITFFLSLVFTLIIPLAHLAAVHSLWDMYTFILPEIHSLAAYAIGLIFYAFHLPECIIPARWTKYTDLIGGGSHAIWHLFIILAVNLHKHAMVEWRRGIGGEVCTLNWGNLDKI